MRSLIYCYDGVVRAVDGIAFRLRKGEPLALKGESGCGKSVTALCLLQLIAQPPGKIVRGGVFFQGEDLLTFSPERMRQLRGRRISMIFQEPMTSLDRFTASGIRSRRQSGFTGRCPAARPGKGPRISEYPHQMSGRMLQRVMIAIAMSCNPEILIADEAVA